MTDHLPRPVLEAPLIHAVFVGDVLSVTLQGVFTQRRLKACLRQLRAAVERTDDYGALVVNALDAQMRLSLDELAGMWGDEGCPLAARPCALLFDRNQEGMAAFYEALGMMLAGGRPARIMGVFPGGQMVTASAWALRRAHGYRLEVARRGRSASSRASSGTPRRKRDPGPDRS